MQVNIDHKEREDKGWFNSTTHYVVRTHVVFTEEELQVIKQRKIGDMVVLERIPGSNLKVSPSDDPSRYFLYVQDLVNGPDNYASATPYDAKEYERELVEMLKKLKIYIDENAEVGGSCSFEL